MIKQNNQYLNNTSPHWSLEIDFQTVWGTKVWCGLIGEKHFLTNELPILLENVPLDTSEHNLFFQQDGILAHNTIIVG